MIKEQRTHKTYGVKDLTLGYRRHVCYDDGRSRVHRSVKVVGCTENGSGSLIELVEQRLGIFQVGGAEAFGEPSVDRREQAAGFAAAALVAAQPGKADGGAQFPELGLLLAGDAEGFVIQLLAWPRNAPAGAVTGLCACSNWPLCLFSTDPNQRSPVLSAICNASFK
jgi:hypothetical protein